MNKSTNDPIQNRPGFTLIEVLIAILILALGLLGLGAVFPVVISQQRQAIAIVDGESVASMAETIVRASNDKIDFSAWFNPASDFGRANASDTFFTYEWIIDPLPPYDGYPERPGYAGGFGGSADGFWYVNLDVLSTPPSSAIDLNKALSVADRLIPQPFSGKAPKYVWDIVTRRQPGSDRPQVAIFIRLIDPRITVPRENTFSEVLVTGVLANDPALPVALDRTTGRPVVDHGRAGQDDYVYAAPQTLQVQVVQDHLDWLIIEDADNTFIDTSISFATKPGQKLLDNTGTVRTVLGPPPSDSNISLLTDDRVRIIRVDPPFQPSHAPTNFQDDGYNESANDPNPVTGTDAERASWIRQIVFTPRTPLAIRVITLEEAAP